MTIMPYGLAVPKREVWSNVMITPNVILHQSIQNGSYPKASSSVILHMQPMQMEHTQVLR